MFCLPDIKRLNAEAASRELRTQIADQLASPKMSCCEVCSWNGVERPAQYAYAWHDIFSDDAKGVIGICGEHDGTTGDPLEGYFTCDHCNRVLIENYSWEIYYLYDEDHGQLCLPCALQLYLEEDSHWIDPRQVRQVVLDQNGERDAAVVLFDRASGTLNLACARHLIGVSMPVPERLRFVGNIELDAYSGRQLATSMATYGPGHGEASALSRIQALAEEGYPRILVIVDAGYQFSISIGLYVDSSESTSEQLHNGVSVPLPVIAGFHDHGFTQSGVAV